MRITENFVDSEVLGIRVLEVSDIEDPTQLTSIDVDWTTADSRFLIVLKLPAGSVALIQRAEELGFRFSECQLRLRRRLTGKPDILGTGFEFFEVLENETLEEVLQLVASLTWLDRFSLDPVFGPDLARARYQAYVRRSFREEDEVVLALRDRSTSRIVAFSTFRRASATEASGFLGGVCSEFQLTGLAVLHYQAFRNYLLERGVKVVTTSVSALHHAAVHSHLNYMGYRVTHTWVVLRKLYG